MSHSWLVISASEDCRIGLVDKVGYSVSPVSVGKCFKDDEPRVRCVARERFVKLSKLSMARTQVQGRYGSLSKAFRFVQGPRVSMTIHCFFCWNSPIWIWSFVSPQREFLAADVRIILHEFDGWSTSIIVWWGKSASATFRFLPMFMLQNMNTSNNSNILQLECIKSWFFVAVWFMAFSHCSKWTGATWQRWHHDKEPAWDHRCLKVWLVKHQSSTKGSQAILGPFRSLFQKKTTFCPSKFHRKGVLGCVRLTIHNISDGCRRCHIRELCSDFYEDAGTPRDTCSSVTRSLRSKVSWVLKYFQGECQNVENEMEPHQKEFLSSGATFEFTGWETRGTADVCLNESVHQPHRIMQTWFAYLGRCNRIGGHLLPMDQETF